MNTFAPAYYNKFQCIADKCRHNCCIGWEIDIDEDTLFKYNSVGGSFGKRLKDNITFDDGTAHFVLDGKERCPFLNCEGLCDIILEMGESALCEICTQHPRFRNFYTHFTEVGLGMCCEEAARIILNEKEPFDIICIDGHTAEQYDDDEAPFFNERGKALDILGNRKLSLIKRFEYLSEKYGFSQEELYFKNVRDLYFGFERFDAEWTSILENASFHGTALLEANEFSIPFEQLACYFVYRYFSEAMYDGNMISRLKFAVASCFAISAICEAYKASNGSLAIDDIVEYSRMYSCEVEYSEENVQKAFEML